MVETAGALMTGYSASTPQLTQACHGRLWMDRYMRPPSLHPELDQALTVTFALTRTTWQMSVHLPLYSALASQLVPLFQANPCPTVVHRDSSPHPLLQLAQFATRGIGASVPTHQFAATDTFVPPARRDHIRQRIACRLQQTVFFTVLHCLVNTLRKADHNGLWLQAISHCCCHCVGVNPLLPECMV